jgi:hypothetical protein
MTYSTSPATSAQRLGRPSATSDLVIADAIEDIQTSTKAPSADDRMVSENTRFVRLNVMSEFMGLIQGVYDTGLRAR